MTAPGENDWTAINQAWLSASLAALRDRLQSRGDALTCYARRPAAASPPAALDILAEKFSLTAFERDVLLLAAAVELDASFAELFRTLGGFSYPTFSLALSRLPGAHWSAVTPTAPLRYWRLIELRPGDTLTASALRIDERILNFLAGVSHLDEKLHGIIRPHHSSGSLSVVQKQKAGAVAALWAGAGLRGEPLPAVQLVAAEDAGAADVAGAACAARNMGLCILRAADLPPGVTDRIAFQRLWEREAALADCGLLVEVEAADGPEVHRAATGLAERCRSALIIACREPLRLASGPLPRFEIGKPPRAEQSELWRRALEPLAAHHDTGTNGASAGDHGNGADVAGDHIDRLVNQFNFSPAAIAATSALAMEGAANREIAAGRLWDVCRAQARTRLDDLAQHIETTAGWDELVLPPAQKQMLHEIVTQVRQRGKVYDLWGFAGKSARGLGVSALFAGQSGTGKTLAAEIMAHELALDLYRIDLSQVVSKYIGETEKNLRRVFEAAETAGAVLLFDEADALFGKRSEVKDSHDRYANMEVSYLLQRMETYRGLAILTTNMQQALDTAFKRRIRFIIQFPFPDEADRGQIWRRVFPESTPVKNLDVLQLARLNVAGGNIRNIALGAAFLAAEESQPVGMAHLLRMAKAEYAKLERPLTDSEIGGWH